MLCLFYMVLFLMVYRFDGQVFAGNFKLGLLPTGVLIEASSLSLLYDSLCVAHHQYQLYSIQTDRLNSSYTSRTTTDYFYANLGCVINEHI